MVLRKCLEMTMEMEMKHLGVEGDIQFMPMEMVMKCLGVEGDIQFIIGKVKQV
jgi:hypothetical protein